MVREEPAIQVGGYVQITQEDGQSGRYVIQQIDPSGVYISPEDQPDNMSRLIQAEGSTEQDEPIWQVDGADQDYRIVFLGLTNQELLELDILPPAQPVEPVEPASHSLQLYPPITFEGTPEVLIDTGRSRFWVIRNFGPDLYPYLQDIELDIEPILGRSFGSGPAYMRRDVGFFSDESEGYRYSGQMSRSRPLGSVPIFPEVLAKINQFLGVTFNGILVNRYRTGEKYISPHADDESYLDKSRKMVAGLIYGPAIRTFRIRRGRNGPIVLDLPHGARTLIVMEGDFQQEFVHEIPVQKREKGERISLTFRHHLK